MLVLGRTREDLALRGDHLVGRAGVVEAAVHERHRFDRAAGDRTADRDRLQLGDHDRDETVGQGRLDEIDERHSRLGDTDPADRIDLEDLREIRDVDLLVAVAEIAGLRNLVRHRLLPERHGPGPGVCAQPSGDPRHLAIVRALGGACFVMGHRHHVLVCPSRYHGDHGSGSIVTAQEPERARAGRRHRTRSRSARRTDRSPAARRDARRRAVARARRWAYRSAPWPYRAS